MEEYFAHYYCESLRIVVILLVTFSQLTSLWLCIPIGQTVILFFIRSFERIYRFYILVSPGAFQTPTSFGAMCLYGICLRCLTHYFAARSYLCSCIIVLIAFFTKHVLWPSQSKPYCPK